MYKYLTDEQMKLIDMVYDEYAVEFRTWADGNESQLMEWYNENPNYGLYESAMRFAYYCADRFMMYKSVLSMIG